MPRSGPRPYECVKRAWHSERHKPMRGLIIQRILRVAAEVHNPVTKKNREWQTKFPAVVMRAEEILYSKANSEGEYMDEDTLWERLNEAIDTIIRRDVSTETGKLLQPCIEAALVLGCVPVKASRSEQNKNPRFYLHPKSQEPAQGTQPISVKPDNYTPPHRPPLPPTNQFLTNSKISNQPTSSPFSTARITPNNSHIASRPFPYMEIESNSVCPLYYDHSGLQKPQNSEPKDILIGRPVGWASRQPTDVPSTLNLLPGETAETITGELRQGESGDSHRKIIAEKDCDLSLRLGPLGAEKAHVIEEGCSSSQQESSENRVKTLEFCFFPGSSASRDSPKSCNTARHGSRVDVLSNDKVENEGGFQDRSGSSRKRKPVNHHQLDIVNGRSRWTGL